MAQIKGSLEGEMSAGRAWHPCFLCPAKYVEEEFDDDTIILQNMSKNGNMDLVCASQSLSLPAVQPLTINDDFRSDYFSSDQSASSIYSNSSNDYSSDDGFLVAIMNLNSRLGQLIQSCKNMNSDLKGISRDMQKK